MDRKILVDLKAWREKSQRLPLILLGARQIGKTFILQDFGKRYFKQCHYLNFEHKKSLRKIFSGDLNPQSLINQIEAVLQITINLKTDFLILDEIQFCPEAITSLKYFAEELPELAVAAAGSLLGIELNDHSFPVGRVDILQMFPMSFYEFLHGIGEEKILSYIHNFKLNQNIPEAVHEKLWHCLKIYLIVGGLPAVINLYKEHLNVSNNTLQLIREKQLALIDSYNADIAKHSGKINAMQIERTWSYIPTLLNQDHLSSSPQFKFKDIIPGKDNRYSKFANAIDWLETTGLVIRIPVLEHIAQTLKSQVKENKFKLFIFDIGILGTLGEINPRNILDYNYGTYKGLFMENFIAQELVCASKTRRNLYSWKQNSAELEFIKELGNQIIGIEVKSGHITKSKSLAAFIDRYPFARGMIFSANNFTLSNKPCVNKYPLYLCAEIIAR